MWKKGRLERLCCALALLGWASGGTAAQQVRGDQVRRALADGLRAIRERQEPNGQWPEHYCVGGETCLATLALLQAGTPPDAPEVARALDFIRALPDERVYVTGLKIMVLAAADAGRFRAEIERSAAWLAAAQGESGLWSYGAGGLYDHSNTQFALLGLHAAAQAGVTVRPLVWNRARSGVLRTQNRDGGWGYREGDASYGSMTAAGVSDLLILGSLTDETREKRFRDGEAPGCGHYRADARLAAGLSWIARNFRPDVNPRHGDSYTFYWLYAVERCGILSGRRWLGSHDWYRAGAAFLVDAQRGDGMWTRELVNTCFAVLFLAKGHKPLLVQKLRWSEDDAWNLDRHDAERLVAFIGDSLGEPVEWQTVAFDAPLEEWLAAPLLYFQGHRFPDWDAAQRGKLRAYVERGGVLLAEACCGRAAFREGFRRFASETFPGYLLRPLDGDHPVYHALHRVTGGTLEGIDVGCRTSVLFSPDDLSCLWEQADVGELSERAFRLGANVAAYAAGRHALRDRLDVVALPRVEDASATAPPAADALRLAQVVYDGDWRPDPLALVRLAEFLRDRLAVDVVTSYRSVRLAPEDLASSPVLFLTGHQRFTFDEGQRRALADHLARGGFLFAEACCGRAEFDACFRALVGEAFPAARLERLAPDHEIYRGEPGFRIESVRLRGGAGSDAAAADSEAGAAAPQLWGAVLNGRLAIVYSPLGVACGWDGHECVECRGLEPSDALRLGANVALYALTR